MAQGDTKGQSTEKISLNEIFQKCGFVPNKDQERAIKHTEGPLLIIAGPGSGKTEVLIYRTLNLILCKDVKPENILLCTFTEKAAEQLKARLKLYLYKCGRDDVDLSKMSVGTINSICNRIIQDHINRFPNLHKNYEVLEELTQALFLYENFGEIFGNKIEEKYLGRWQSLWYTIEHATLYFNKITEECIDVECLKKDSRIFVQQLAGAYLRYREKLDETNRIDFSLQQRYVLDLVRNDAWVREKLRNQYQYIMIDEYQDTNYVQEQLLLDLAKPKNNICVVGDDDQALYRFRGATVRNILEFKSHFKNELCEEVKLQTNYRSHRDIIAIYNEFMKSPIWEDKGKLKYRFPKKITHDPKSREATLDYTSVFVITGQDSAPKKVAEIILFLKQKKIISDLNQVAFFMRSIAFDNVKPFLEEFANRGIPYYAPRAKKYFENDEVREIVACFMQVLSENEEEVPKEEDSREIKTYLKKAFENLKFNCETEQKYSKLAEFLDETSSKIQKLTGRDTLEIGLLDIFYQILSYEPFSSYLEDESKARNLAIFSRLLLLFQQYYHLPIITAKNKHAMAERFFHSYLRFLVNNGLNEYEDPYDIFPSGKVQIMTIHQAKGLEFPVVFVAGLEKKNPPSDISDKILGSYYHRKEFEPYDRMIDFDQMRLSYVAFSRSQYLLGLISTKAPFKYYKELFEVVPNIDSVDKNKWMRINVKVKERRAAKLEYSFTSHINVYDTCPRQYLMYKEYEFTPARAAQRIFGALVHQTIEDIHRHVLEMGPDNLNEDLVIEYFEKNKRGFIKQGVHPFNAEAAKDHVLNYFRNNKEIIAKVKETEVEVVVEKNDYFLKGILDLIAGDDGSINILDFKAQSRPLPDSPAIENYRRQLAIYSHIVEKKKGVRPARTMIYWTGEVERNNAIMEIDSSPGEIENVVKHFDEVVQKIRKKEFNVGTKPDKKTCAECDFRHCCQVKD